METAIAVVCFAVTMAGRQPRAFVTIVVGAALVLVGCQVVLGIDPDSRHESALCAAFVAFDTRCNVTDKCDLARVAACANNEAIGSPGAIAAYIACASLAPCAEADGGTDAGAVYEDCLAVNYGAPTTLLTTLVARYCTQCGAESMQPCVIGPVAQNLATFDDAILTEVRDTCLVTPAATDDAGTSASCANFTRCTNDIVAAAAPPPVACSGR